MEDNPDDIVLAEIAIRQAAIPFRLRQFANIAAATISRERVVSPIAPSTRYPAPFSSITSWPVAPPPRPFLNSRNFRAATRCPG